MSKLICQSCGLALDRDFNFGTEIDGTKCVKFCVGCYQNGAFTEPALTAAEMQVRVVDTMRTRLHIPTPVGRFLAEKVPSLDRWQAT